MASSTINSQLTVLDVSYVAPHFESPELATEFSLPLTFFDTLWFKFPPVQCTYFYKHDGLTLNKFDSEFVPRFKHSLSLTLSSFLPLAGNIMWPDNAPMPFILYSPNDAVLVKIAQSDIDFGVVSSKHVHEAVLSRNFVSELQVSETKASIIALQITLFPNQGFCIALTTHHAIVDGKTATMFTKAWAYVCKHFESDKRPCLPPQLAPFMDRKGIKDPERLDKEFLNMWSGFKFPGLDNARSLKLLPSVVTVNEPVRGSFMLSREDVRMLRNVIMSQLSKDHKETESLHLSTFVLSFAYAVVCQAKAVKAEKEVLLVFSVDCRTRLEPPIHENYFGCCVRGSFMVPKFDSEGTLLENIVSVVKKSSELIKGLDKGVLIGLKEKTLDFFKEDPGNKLIIGVAGSTKFGFYEMDFGWGKPVLVEVTSIDRNGGISMAESGDGNGGVEIGVVLEKHEMEKFVSLFAEGIRSL